ncbi:MAG: bifunctional DNA-formamidopyrimidine glycosylase/DNA-(apurinic or apyrimidinic site) lyase [Syntrophomonadaceae bacterium]
MPELPEVETIKNSLQSIVGEKVSQIDVRRKDIIRLQEYEPGKVTGSPISAVTRRGKYLVISFKNQLYLVIHLGMSGRIYLQGSDQPVDLPHVHLIVHLGNHQTLVYQDPRRFGGVWFLRDIQPFFARLGIEPLTGDFTPDYLEQITRGRRIAIKSLLLVQNLISGIGNIYADEALFEAGIRPSRPAQSLSREEIGKLCQAIKKVLQKSIRYRGTTFRDYRDGSNQPGSFQDELKVYGKINQKCPVCDQILRREKIGGRSSFFCPGCQR